MPKRCCQCAENLPIRRFSRSRRTADGYQPYCSACGKTMSPNARSRARTAHDATDSGRLVALPTAAQPPAPTSREPMPIIDAARSSRLDLLIAARHEICQAIEAGVPARDLASLTRRLSELAAEIEELEMVEHQRTNPEPLDDMTFTLTHPMPDSLYDNGDWIDIDDDRHPEHDRYGETLRTIAPEDLDFEGVTLRQRRREGIWPYDRSA